jgi:hypothetical protein
MAHIFMVKMSGMTIQSGYISRLQGGQSHGRGRGVHSWPIGNGDQEVQGQETAHPFL